MRWLSTFAVCAMLATPGFALAQVWRCPGINGPVFTDKPCFDNGTVQRKQGAKDTGKERPAPKPFHRAAAQKRTVPATPPAFAEPSDHAPASAAFPEEAEHQPLPEPAAEAPSADEWAERRPMPAVPSSLSICPKGFCLDN